MNSSSLSELRYRCVVITNLKLHDLLEGLRVQEMERRRAVTHDQVPSVVSEPPAIGGIGESATELKCLFIVDEADPGLIGELNDGIVPDGNALAQVARGQLIVFKDLTCFPDDLSQSRFTAPSGSFVEVK